MAKAVDYSTERTGMTSLGLLTKVSERDPFLPNVDYTDNGPSPFETAGAMFMQDTIIGALADEIVEKNNLRKFKQPDFNPYSFFKEEQANYGDIEYFVRKGYFHDVASPEAFNRKAEAVRREMSRRADIAQGDIIGLGLGMGLSFADVSTAIPVVGWAGKGGVAFKAGVGALNAGAVVGAQEVLLHQLQDTRTFGESLFATGVGTVLGGGIGTFVGVMSKGHPLHPSNPANPMDVNNPVSFESTVGAARTTGEKVEYADSTGLGFFDATGYLFKIPTAVARKIARIDPETAGVMENLSSTGMMTKSAEQGVRRVESAEDIYFAEYQNLFVVTRESMSDAFREMNVELGGKLVSLKDDLSAVTGGRIKNAVPEKDFMSHLFKTLNNPDYKTGDAVVDKYVGQAAGEVRRYFDHMGKRAVELGLMKQDDLLDNYLVQRWVTHAVSMDSSNFKAWLLQKFSKEPDEDWLMDGYGISPDEFKQLTPEDSRLKEILEDWNVEKEAADLRMAEYRAETAEKAAKDAAYQFMHEAKKTRAAVTTAGRLEVKEARASVQAKEAELFAARERLENLRLEEASFVEAATAARTKTLARQEEFIDVMPKPRKGGKAKEAPRTPEVIEQSARAKMVGDARLKQEAKVKRIEARVNKLRARADDLEAKFTAAKVARQSAREALSAARAALKSAKTASRRATSKVKALEKRKGLPEAVDDIVNALTDRRKAPLGFLNDLTFQSGRLKHRGIRLTPDEIEEAVSYGWLDTDVGSILEGYSRDIGGRLALMEKFGSIDLAAETKAIKDRFADLRAKATDDAAKRDLLDQEKAAIDTVDLLIRRVRGLDGIPEDPETALMYLGRVMRLTNFVRYMGSVLPASITDLATGALVNGGMGRTLVNFGKPIGKLAKGMKDREMKALLWGAENSLVFSRHGRVMALDDLVYTKGFGDGMTRKVSAAVEIGLKSMAEKMNVLNGMAWWNHRLRFIAGQVQLQNVVADAAHLKAGKALEQHRIAEYARLGLDTDDLQNIATMIEKHGETNEYGMIDLNGGAWLDTEGGRELHRRMLVFLKRAAQEAVIAPTYGDLPPLMSSQAGKLILQFQTFGFASVNKYVRNLRYKAVNGQAWDALLSTTFALALGTTAYVLKEGVIKNRELSDKPATWVYEAIDRSGLMGYFMPFANGAFKLGAPAMTEMGIDWFDVPSRYRQASWLTAFLGPSFGLLEDIQATGAAVSAGDLDRAVDKAGRLVPYNNLFYWQFLMSTALGKER